MTETKEVATKQSANVATYDDSLYESYDNEAAEAEQDELDSEGNGTPMDKLVEGRNPRRILPPPKGTAWGSKGKPSPFKKVWQHRLEIPGSRRPLIFNCPRRMGKGKCGVCEEAMRLDKSGNPIDKDLAFELFPKRKIYVNWVDRDNPEAGVRVGELGIKIYKEIADLREECGDFAHPVNGYDLIVKRKGTQRDTTYKVIKGPSCVLHEDPRVGTEWIQDQYNLDNYAEVPGESGMRSIMEQVEKILDAIGGGGGGSGGGRRRRRDDDRSSSSSSRRRGGGDDDRSSRRSSRSAQEDRDDDDDDEDDDDED